MILGNQAIYSAIKQGKIGITPLLEPLQPTSVDLRLFHVIIAESGTIHTLTESDTYDLYPGEFVLASTQEIVSLPTEYLVGILMGKSSLARLGIQVEAAGYVDPGWHGRLTLEIKNLTRDTILALQPGMKICQIRFEAAVGVSLLYGDAELSSHYQDASGPQRADPHGLYAHRLQSDLSLE